MTASRILLVVAGLAAAAYGAVLVLDLPGRTIALIAVWAGGGVIVHDFVFAPLSAVLGYTGRRLVKGSWWAPIAVAALCSATLIFLAVPVLDTPGAKPDNPTVLDRDYPMGLMISLLIIWACVPLYQVGAALMQRRRANN
ncbi:hypothetical protein [Mycolicibacterium sp. S3B2]|uniref:hypothetical protein n=1 Tax=Mycolicibacterium sp. S3B2 TaxID=3415120 RepID=UPI003C7B1971